MRTRLPLARALLLVAIGCTADNRSSIEIAAICAPPSQAQACTFSSKCDKSPLGTTFIDLGVTNQLVLVMQVNNQLPSNANKDDYRVNTNDAWVQEYAIEYDGLPVGSRVGPIPAGSKLVPTAGSAVMAVPAVDDYVGNALASYVSYLTSTATGYVDAVAHLKLRGVYANGSEFETGQFDINFVACVNCWEPVVCATSSDVLYYCPRNEGQGPVSAECVAP